jgi:hypothetical protein
VAARDSLVYSPLFRNTDTHTTAPRPSQTGTAESDYSLCLAPCCPFPLSRIRLVPFVSSSRASSFCLSWPFPVDLFTKHSTYEKPSSTRLYSVLQRRFSSVPPQSHSYICSVCAPSHFSSTSKSHHSIVSGSAGYP